MSASQLTNIFQRGWNHQPDTYCSLCWTLLSTIHPPVLRPSDCSGYAGFGNQILLLEIAVLFSIVTSLGFSSVVGCGALVQNGVFFPWNGAPKSSFPTIFHSKLSKPSSYWDTPMTILHPHMFHIVSPIQKSLRFHHGYNLLCHSQGALVCRVAVQVGTMAGWNPHRMVPAMAIEVWKMVVKPEWFDVCFEVSRIFHNLIGKKKWKIVVCTV